MARIRLRSAWTDRSLRSKGLIVIAIPLLALLLIAPAVYVSTREEAKTTETVEQSLALVEQIEDTRALIFESVARMRGYVLTDDPTFLELYEGSASELPGAIARLRRLPGGGPEWGQQVDAVEKVALELLGNLEQTRAASGGPELAALVDRTREQTDDLQARLNEMRDEVESLLSVQRRAAEAARRRETLVIAVIVPVSILVGSVAILLFTTGITRRIQRIRDNASRLARQEPLTSLPEGRDEIASLGEALEDANRLLHERSDALRESEARLRALVDNSTSVIFMKDADGRFLVMNRVFESLFGISRDEAIGKTVHDLFDASDADAWRENDLQVMRDGVPAQFEEVAPAQDGERVFLSTKVPLLDEHGEPSGLIGISTDITDRKRAEEEARRYADAVRDLYDNAPCGYHSLDAEGRVLRVNDTELAWLGYAREDVIGRPFVEFVTADGRDVFEASLTRLQERRSVGDLELELVLKDGRILPVLVTASAIFDDDDRFVSSRNTVVDMSDYRHAERNAAIQASVLSLVSDAVVVVDGQGRVVMWNRAAEQLYGWTQEEVLGRSAVDVVPVRYPDSSEEDVGRSLAETGTWRGEVRQRTRTGDEILAEIATTAITEAGQLNGYVSVIRDVTETTRMRAFLDSVVENIPHMVFVKDAQSLRFVRFNAAGEALLGQSRDALIGRNDYDFFPKEQADFFTAKDRDVLAQGGVVDIAEEAIDTPAGRRLLHTKKIPIRDEDGTALYLLGISEDITERREAERGVQAAHEEAERANRAKSEFLSRMSHELRTPLNAILGFAQLLEMDDLEGDQNDNVAQILKAGRHLLDLINEVLEISRIEAGRLSLSPEPVRVADALREALELIKPLAADKGVAINLAADVDGTHVVADRQRLKQVLLNLLANAVKYNREAGSVTLDAELAEDRFRIHVLDTGPGIAPADLERLFTPFDRLAHAAGNTEGTGLGLALSKGLVEAMGGSISVASTLGAGSVFTVELPLAENPITRFEREEADGAVAQDGATAKDGAVAGNGTAAEEEVVTIGTVLYIEDNVSNLRLIERVLERRPGIRLLSALQGSVGIDVAREHRPDLVLLDVHLPDIDGAEVLKALRQDERTQDLRVVVISADATSSQVRRLMSLGANAYMTKPLDMVRFLELVDAALAGEDQPDGTRAKA